MGRWSELLLKVAYEEEKRANPREALMAGTQSAAQAYNQDDSRQRMLGAAQAAGAAANLPTVGGIAPRLGAAQPRPARGRGRLSPFSALANAAAAANPSPPMAGTQSAAQAYNQDALAAAQAAAAATNLPTVGGIAPRLGAAQPRPAPAPAPAPAAAPAPEQPAAAQAYNQDALAAAQAAAAATNLPTVGGIAPRLGAAQPRPAPAPAPAPAAAPAAANPSLLQRIFNPAGSRVRQTAGTAATAHGAPLRGRG